MPGLLGEPGLFEAGCLKAMFCLLLFCLLGFIFGSSLLIGAPTSSGVFILLLKFLMIFSIQKYLSFKIILKSIFKN